jgi:hypothetical protein
LITQFQDWVARRTAVGEVMGPEWAERYFRHLSYRPRLTWYGRLLRRLRFIFESPEQGLRRG